MWAILRDARNGNEITPLLHYQRIPCTGEFVLLPSGARFRVMSVLHTWNAINQPLAVVDVEAA